MSCVKAILHPTPPTVNNHPNPLSHVSPFPTGPRVGYHPPDKTGPHTQPDHRLPFRPRFLAGPGVGTGAGGNSENEVIKC